MFHALWKALGREKLDRVHTCSELKFGTPLHLFKSSANCRGSPLGLLPWETWPEEAHSWFPGLPQVIIKLDAGSLC